MDFVKEVTGQKICSGRRILDPVLFNTDNPDDWEKGYQLIFDQKYKKNTRSYSTTITGCPVKGEPPIYLIPRERGGPSYKSVDLEGCDIDDVQYCLVSKGFPMQDLSSFTLGPIVGEGLCLVNAAFSKSICVMHIEGGGKFNLGRKSFWQSSKKPLRKIKLLNDQEMEVDSLVVDIHKWLKDNESLWLDEWIKWRNAIALCSIGDFHWTDNSPTVAYRASIGKYLDFVRWKKQCYIKPSYRLMPSIEAYKFIHDIWKYKKIPIGLVHPMAITGRSEKPIDREYLTELFNSRTEMCCQPFVIAGKLLGVPID